MSDRVKELAKKAGLIAPYGSDREGLRDFDYREFAKLIIEETLKEVDERCYGRGENSWHYEDDKKWIRMHFGIGK